MSSPAHRPRARIDHDALDVFLHHYKNADLPGGSISTILTSSFQALLDAGVVVVDDLAGKDTPSINVHGGDVKLSAVDEGGSDTWWTPQPSGSLPSFDPALTGLVHLLVHIVNGKPWTGPLPRPHTRN